MFDDSAIDSKKRFFLWSGRKGHQNNPNIGRTEFEELPSLKSFDNENTNGPSDCVMD
jgi:hypothetical protein